MTNNPTLTLYGEGRLVEIAHENRAIVLTRDEAIALREDLAEAIGKMPVNLSGSLEALAEP